MRVWQLLFVVLLPFTGPASAQTVDISDYHGGLISAYQNQWSTLAAQGVKVRIVGPCVSACTLVLSYVPRENICVMPNAYLGFHWATTAFHTQELWSAYPPDIRQWIYQRGGLTDQMISFAGAEPVFAPVLLTITCLHDFTTSVTPFVVNHVSRFRSWL
jgi:hypothetical protein